MDYKKLYYTDNPEHASFLMACKQTMESLYWTKGSCVFVFENEAECEKLISGILKGKIKADPISLFEAIKTVKGIINLNIES